LAPWDHIKGRAILTIARKSGKKVNRDPYGFERGLLNEITEYKAITKMPAAEVFESATKKAIAKQKMPARPLLPFSSKIEAE
jgi:hypothetical protein